MFLNAAKEPATRCRANFSTGQQQGTGFTRRLVRIPDTQFTYPAMGDTQKRTVTIAVEGCCHGELDNIYASLQHLERVEGRKIDLLISCGDFQAVRNMDDLETMACPPKYRDINTFYKYYSGEKKPPFPTLFIGGNHEAANHLWELYYGGWAAPDIYFLGFTGAVKFAGLRIAGLSGIYKQQDYMRGHHERLPYDDSTMRSIYHVRDFEVDRLMQVKEQIDIFLSHDWPRNIARHGDTRALLREKTFLAREVETGELGSPASEQLLHTLRPSYWFAAHLHTKFGAVVQHPDGKATRFLALNKCLPGRDFLQVIELEAKGPLEFEYDPEWLAIMRTTHSQMNLLRQHRALPGMGGSRAGPAPEDVAFVQALLEERGTHRIPHNFVPTAPAYDPSKGPRQRGHMPAQHVRNPQTVQLLNMLQLPYNLDHSEVAPRQQPQQQQQQAPHQPSYRGGALPGPPAAAPNPEEIDLGDLDGGGEEEQQGGQQGKCTGEPHPKRQRQQAQPPTAGLQSNPEEIDLGDLDDDEGAAEDGGGGDKGDDVISDDEEEEQQQEAGGGLKQGGSAAEEEDAMFKPMTL